MQVEVTDFPTHEVHVWLLYKIEYDTFSPLVLESLTCCSSGGTVSYLLIIIHITLLFDLIFGRILYLFLT